MPEADPPDTEIAAAASAHTRQFSLDANHKDVTPASAPRLGTHSHPDPDSDGDDHEKAYEDMRLTQPPREGERKVPVVIGPPEQVMGSGDGVCRLGSLIV